MQTINSPYYAPLYKFVENSVASVMDHIPASSELSAEIINTLRQQFLTLPHLAGDIVFDVALKETITECVVLYRGIIFVVAIDAMSSEHNAEHIQRVHHFAQLLKQHHTPSKSGFIVPVLLTLNALPQGCDITVSEQLIAETICDNGEHFAALIEHLSNQYKADQIILSDWLEIVQPN